MVKIYYNRIVSGQIKLREVPRAYRKEVKAMLIENGYESLT